MNNKLLKMEVDEIEKEIINSIFVNGQSDSQFEVPKHTIQEFISRGYEIDDDEKVYLSYLSNVKNEIDSFFIDNKIIEDDDIKKSIERLAHEQN